MSSSRERILARRAAFVAAALGTISRSPSVRADEPPPVVDPPPPDQEPQVCLNMVQPCLSPPPPGPPPHVCLSPPPDPETNHDAWDVGVGIEAPALLLPMTSSEAEGSVGKTHLGIVGSLFVQRQVPGGSLRLGLRGGTLRATSDASAPLGGALAYFLDVRPSGWDFEHRLAFGLEVGGGAFFGDRTRPYLEVAATPLGFVLYAKRGMGKRPMRALTLGLRGSMLMIDTGDASGSAFGVRAFTLGLDLTFSFQFAKPSYRYGGGDSS